MKLRNGFLATLLTIALGGALSVLSAGPANAAPAADLVAGTTTTYSISSRPAGGVTAQATITCSIVVHNPHESRHVPGVVNVISRVQCTAPVASLDGIVGLYRNGAGVSHRGGRNFAVTALQLNTAAPCATGVYQGHAIADVVFPPGFIPAGGRIGNSSVSVGITC